MAPIEGRKMALSKPSGAEGKKTAPLAVSTRRYTWKNASSGLPPVAATASADRRITAWQAGGHELASDGPAAQALNQLETHRQLAGDDARTTAHPRRLARRGSFPNPANLSLLIPVSNLD